MPTPAICLQITHVAVPSWKNTRKWLWTSCERHPFELGNRWRRRNSGNTCQASRRASIQTRSWHTQTVFDKHLRECAAHSFSLQPEHKGIDHAASTFSQAAVWMHCWTSCSLAPSAKISLGTSASCLHIRAHPSPTRWEATLPRGSLSSWSVNLHLQPAIASQSSLKVL